MPPPPPAPPPPPPLHVSTSFLQSRGRTSTNSNGETHNTVSAPSDSSAPRLDAQTLQCAAAGLRKIEYDRPLRSVFESVPNGRMDRSDQFVSGRYRQNNSFDEAVEPNKTRETFHASPSGAHNAVSLGDVYRYSNTLKNEFIQQPVQQSSYSSSSYQHYSNYQNNTNSNHQQTNPQTYIQNPTSIIRAYATQTPAYTLFGQPSPSKAVSHSQQPLHSQSHYSTLFSSTDPISYYRQATTNHGTQFARELRDLGLTKSQRIANQFKQSHLRDVTPPPTLHNLYRQERSQNGDQIDSLIRDMEWKMKTGVGAAGENNCCKCGEEITNERPGCTALEQMFHVACFTCKQCNKQLAGASFYNVDGKPLCEQDYKNSLERCVSCGEPIMHKLLRASGSAYHPGCFVCSVCKKCLDGVPFTVDSSNSIHCVTCFHQKFAPRCAMCSQPIIPEEGEKESVRVVAMDKSFHVNCYRCEDCNVQLSSKLDGEGCYPLDQHLYCKTCNGKRLIALSRAA